MHRPNSSNRLSSFKDLLLLKRGTVATNYVRTFIFNVDRRVWLRSPLVVLRGSVPLPRNVKPFRCVDFVAVESFAVGLICKPSRKMVDGGVAETRLTHS